MPFNDTWNQHKLNRVALGLPVRKKYVRAGGLKNKMSSDSLLGCEPAGRLCALARDLLTPIRDMP